ncbi:MAG TPA: rhodanese-like domain-containing protein [Marmoricola sp.]|jgi:rhodanese-related sulfurtransferase|nr:rhodanese-like domain-containing protein [Marmoricola sp.]
MYAVPSVTVAQVPDPLPEGVSVLDVREPQEWEAGHIDGATHIPLRELPEHTDVLPRDDQLVVVCKIGGRSAQAVAYLGQLGVNAVNLVGGMIDWVDAGRPIVREGDGEPLVV